MITFRKVGERVFLVSPIGTGKGVVTVATTKGHFTAEIQMDELPGTFPLRFSRDGFQWGVPEFSGFRVCTAATYGANKKRFKKCTSN